MMINIPIHLAFWGLVLVMSTFASFVSAQNTESSIRLEVIALSDIGMPTLYYLDGANSTYQPFKIGVNSRGSFNDWIPQSSLVLYKKARSSEGEDVFTAVSELEPSGTSRERVLFLYRDLNGRFRHRFIDDDYGRFDEMSVRFVNLTESSVVCLLETDRVEVPSNSEAIRRPDVSLEERFRFTFQLLDADRMAIRAPVKTLRFIRPEMRLMFVFSYERVEVQGDRGESTFEFRPKASRLYDFVPSS